MTEVVALPPPPPPSTSTLQPSSSSSPTATTIAHALSEASDTGTPTLTETLSSSIDSQKPNSKVEEEKEKVGDSNNRTEEDAKLAASLALEESSTRRPKRRSKVEATLRMSQQQKPDYHNEQLVSRAKKRSAKKIDTEDPNAPRKRKYRASSTKRHGLSRLAEPIGLDHPSLVSETTGFVEELGVTFPLKFGQLFIHSMGRIVWDRHGFHTTGQIFPAGYKSSREFPSMVHPDERVRYVSEILDDGGQAPVFQITPPQGHGEPQRSASASGAAKSVLIAVNKARGRISTQNAISGPNFFGLTHPIVNQLLLKLDGVSKLKGFIPGHGTGRGSGRARVNYALIDGVAKPKRPYSRKPTTNYAKAAAKRGRNAAPPSHEQSEASGSYSDDDDDDNDDDDSVHSGEDSIVSLSPSLPDEGPAQSHTSDNNKSHSNSSQTPAEASAAEAVRALASGFQSMTNTKSSPRGFHHAKLRSRRSSRIASTRRTSVDGGPTDATPSGAANSDVLANRIAALREESEVRATAADDRVAQLRADLSTAAQRIEALEQLVGELMAWKRAQCGGAAVAMATTNATTSTTTTTTTSVVAVDDAALSQRNAAAANLADLNPHTQ